MTSQDQLTELADRCTDPTRAKVLYANAAAMATLKAQRYRASYTNDATDKMVLEAVSLWALAGRFDAAESLIERTWHVNTEPSSPPWAFDALTIAVWPGEDD